MAQQQIGQDPTQFNLDQMYQDEDAGMLPADAKAQLEAWRAAGTLPKRTPKIPEPPLPNMDQSKGAVGRFITDPEQSLPAAGGVVGGAAAGALTGGNPWAVRFGSGAGAATGTYAAKAIKQKTFTPEGAGFDSALQGAMGFAMPTGRKLGDVISGRGLVKKQPLTAIGAQTKDILGDRALVSDLIDSPSWDFARNVASEGFLGRKSMLEHETKSGQILRDKVIEEAHKALPGNVPMPPSMPFNAERSQAGQAVKDTLKKNYDTDRTAAGQLYEPFMQQYGQTTGTAISGGVKTNFTFEQLHKARSEALRAGRDAAASGDLKAKAAAVKLQNEINDAMEQLIGPQGKAQYDSISGNYRDMMDVHENEFTHWLREGGGTPAEKILDIFEHPDRLHTFTPDRNITLGGAGGAVRGNSVIQQGKTISQADAVHLFREAVGEDAFKQFRGDSLFHFAQNHVKTMKSGAEILDGAASINALKQIDPNVQRALYGTGAADRINKIAQVADHVQRARGGTGALWIIMRQPSVALGAGAAVAGAMTGAGIPSPISIVTGGTILMSPQIFSAVLRNPKSAQLFTQAVGAVAPTMKERLVKELTAQLVRIGAFAGAEHLVNDNGGQQPVQPVQSSSLNPTGLSIPTPPARTGPPPPRFPQ